MAGLRDGDVHEVPAQVQVDCHSLPNGDDVFIEPPHRRPQRYGRGERHRSDHCLGGVLESGVYESGIERDGSLCRRPKVQEREPHLRRLARRIVHHVLAVGRGRQDSPLFFAVRFPVGCECCLGIIPRDLHRNHSAQPRTSNPPTLYPVILPVRADVVAILSIESQFDGRNLVVPKLNVVILPFPVNDRSGVSGVDGCFVLFVM